MGQLSRQIEKTGASMLDDKGFDLWADGYDAAVELSDEDDTYPFAGYRRVLGRIYEAVLAKDEPDVLDIGFGTATLTAMLYDAGCSVYGQDFSARMIDLAREKMPRARLFPGDFGEGLHPALLGQRYDFIVSTYAMHHLDDERKAAFIRSLLSLLKPGGAILIGDIAFETRADLDACRLAAGDEWDGEESYFVAEELRKQFPALEFEKVSHCSGIISIENDRVRRTT